MVARPSQQVDGGFANWSALRGTRTSPWQWAFVAGVVLQVFFIGLGLFAASEYRELHAFFGWTILRRIR